MGEESSGTLLDFAQTLGRIEGQNMLILQEQGRASEQRKDHYQALEAVRHDIADSKHSIAGAVESVKAVAERVTLIEPNVTSMKQFRTQLALVVVFVTTAVTGACNMIWLAISHMSQIKAAIASFLTPH